MPIAQERDDLAGRLQCGSVDRNARASRRSRSSDAQARPSRPTRATGARCENSEAGVTYAFLTFQAPPAASASPLPRGGSLDKVSLKNQLDRELHDARIGSRGDRPERRRPERAVWGAKGRRVRGVEDLGADFHRVTGAQSDTAQHRDVEVAVTRAAHRVSRTRANRELGGRRRTRRY